MGLLDSVLGAALGGGQQGGQGGGLASILGSVLGGGGQQGGGLNAGLITAAISMLGNDTSHGAGLGGLGGLVAKFQQAGLGDAMGSWIGSGENHAISGDQLTNVLGSGAIGDIAAKLGMSQGDAAGQLSQILPGLINHLTPNGQAPAGGLGNSGDLMGMLGGLLQQK